ncbi:hypothetical protein [Sphingopyxis terrae]|uniref:hypothetical protein n=1 Tax=Sphingopyxis terrae TaxID=33052 RepID=UPI0007873A69|nr:hypothetical protein [Sphingopyxis terrae]
MTDSYRARSRQGGQAFRLNPRLLVAGFVGAMLAALSFSQVAASIGVAIETFRPLGGSFFSWRAGQRNLALSLYQGRKKATPATLIAAGRAGLIYAPLSARSMWLVGQGFEARKRNDAALRVMTRAEKVTRRDAAVQLWLGDNKLRKGKIAASLRHYDLIIRTEPEAGGEVINRLAAIMTAREGRRYLFPYIRADNEWLPSLLVAATERLPKAEPIGRLFLERKGKAPNLPELDPTYARLVLRLVSEGADDVALQLYPLLPQGSNAALANVSGVVGGKPLTGYPPFIWYFPDGEPQGGTLVGLDDGGSGIEFFGASGTVGNAATKLIAPQAATQLRWRVQQRSPNLQSAASWVATCLSGKAEGQSRASIDLLGDAAPLRKTLTMQLPADCELVRLEMRVTGGIGRDPASLIVSHLGLAKAAVGRD